jgi:hypothetical protein
MVYGFYFGKGGLIMGKNIVQKIIESHLVSGRMIPGEEMPFQSTRL